MLKCAVVAKSKFNFFNPFSVFIKPYSVLAVKKVNKNCSDISTIVTRKEFFCTSTPMSKGLYDIKKRLCYMLSCSCKLANIFGLFSEESVNENPSKNKDSLHQRLTPGNNTEGECS